MLMYCMSIEGKAFKASPTNCLLIRFRLYDSSSIKPLKLGTEDVLRRRFEQLWIQLKEH